MLSIISFININPSDEDNFTSPLLRNAERTIAESAALLFTGEEAVLFIFLATNYKEEGQSAVYLLHCCSSKRYFSYHPHLGVQPS